MAKAASTGSETIATSLSGKAGAPLTLGLDSGSTTTKCVLFGGGVVLGSALTPTTGDIQRAADKVLDELNVADCYRNNLLQAAVTTGSGRSMLESCCRKRFRKLKVKSVTEITCHGAGAFFIDPRVRMVVDIGGQDSKVIAISQSGAVEDFLMNDKCAAGTGRFFELIATVLNLPMEELVQSALRARRSVSITNTCAVFAESEVISHLAAGQSKSSILSGIHDSMAQRIFSLIRSLGCRKPIIMTGGVARNRAMVRSLEKKVGHRIVLAPDPQTVGALGAAILAANIV
jgi:predicted CoA-substrate-specific enzyme activase